VSKPRPAPEAAGRRTRGRPAVPLERIIATAIQILDEQGADALSMRTLAQRMESGTATLYRHFAGRAELIAHVVDAVMGEAEFDDAALRAAPWQQACVTMATNMFEVFRRHPHVAPLMVEHIPLGPNAMAQRNRGIAVLLAAGFPPLLAVQAWATLARFVLGMASQLTGSGSAPERPAVWPTIDPESFPAILAVAEYLPIPLEREFTFGLQLLLTGLDQLARD
jgi:AcrR family transcriptional regulator